MKVFVSWSGSVSHGVALLLRDWLSNVLQYARPYVSSKDIDRGAVWFTEIATELQNSDYGIVCLTKQNMASTWIHFEAGAIFSRFGKGRVATLLIELSPGDVPPPLGQLQATSPDAEQMFQLVATINSMHEQSIDDAKLRQSFDKWWPDFEEGYIDLTSQEPELGNNSKQRKDRDVLEEVLSLSRRTVEILSNRSEISSEEGHPDLGLGLFGSPALRMFPGIEPGARVFHQTFGEGKVLSVEGHGDKKSATVFFQKAGQKSLKLKFARLQVVD